MSRTGSYSRGVRALRIVVLAVVLAGGLEACGAGPSPYEIMTAGPASTVPRPTATATATAGGGGSGWAGALAATTTTAVPVPTTAPTPTSVGGSTTVPVPPTTPPTTPAPVPAMLAQVGASVGQAIVVTAPATGASSATLTAFQRGSGAGGAWSAVFGPWPARIGSNGFAPPGEKREGDGRTPSGSYGFDFLFGVDPDPGVKFEYRRITQSIVWVDDPASPLYNQWVDRSQRTVTARAENMYQPTAYRYGAAIAYNSARTPDLGSAIFLHASTGSATAGCVSLHVDQLVQLLTWLDPARDPRIVMGLG